MNNQERLDMLKGEWTQRVLWSKESKKWLLQQTERVDELEKQNEQYREALEFYANKGNYSGNRYSTVIDFDRGIKAHNTLLGEER